MFHKMQIKQPWAYSYQTSVDMNESPWGSPLDALDILPAPSAYITQIN